MASVLAVVPIPALLVMAVFEEADGLNRDEAEQRQRKAFHDVTKASLAEIAGEQDARSVHTLVSRAMRFHEKAAPERTQTLRAALVALRAALIVEKGDTLSSIARKHGVTVRGLKAANQLAPDVNVIYAGQVLIIPEEHVAIGGGGGGLLTVRKGDSLSSIARKHGVSVQELRARNNIARYVNLIHPGQLLIIPEGRPVLSWWRPQWRRPQWLGGDSAKIRALRNGLDEGWVVTRNAGDDDSGKLFVHRSAAGGVLRDLLYLVKEIGDTWFVYLPVGFTSSGTRYGRRVGIMSKPTNVSVGSSTCM
jgi:LysM repeat protein